MQLIAKVESVIKRMRQKPLKFFNKLSSSKIETYGFLPNKCPSTVDELSAFETDLLIMIRNIEFRKITDVLQSKLQEDIKQLDNQKMFLFQLIDQQIINAMRNMITIDSLGKTLRKHKKNRKKVKSINYKAKKPV